MKKLILYTLLIVFILPACTLLLLQPDFGSTVVLLTVTAALFFLAGFKLRYFFLLIIILALLFSALVYFSPYKLARVVSFMDPWSMADKGGYQLVNSLIAIGSGGFFGVGLGEGVQKLFYLPEAHTDFIFAIIAEELGLMGTILFLSFYTLLISRIFIIAFKAITADRLFQGYLCFSIGIWISIQVIINLGVNMGLLPTKGLILPLISYGSSSMIMTLITLAIVLRIGCEIPREKINKKINYLFAKDLNSYAIKCSKIFFKEKIKIILITGTDPINLSKDAPRQSNEIEKLMKQESPINQLVLPSIDD